MAAQPVDYNALMQAAVTALDQARAQADPTEVIVKRLRNPKALTLFPLASGKWDEWMIQLRAQLISLECEAALDADNADGTVQLTPLIQTLLKAKIAPYLRGNDVHRIMHPIKSVYTILNEIKAERSGAEQVVMIDHNNALMDLYRKPAESIVDMCARASEHYRKLLDQKCDMSNQIFVMCIMRAATRNQFYAAQLHNAQSHSNFQYTVEHIIQICQPVDTRAVKETADLYPAKAADLPTASALMTTSEINAKINDGIQKAMAAYTPPSGIKDFDKSNRGRGRGFSRGRGRDSYRRQHASHDACENCGLTNHETADCYRPCGSCGKDGHLITNCWRKQRGGKGDKPQAKYQKSNTGKANMASAQVLNASSDEEGAVEN
jgi:hypothetical protein